jgi:hypothetical protein
MKKKILFGGIFVLTLLLLMPSIPAVQYVVLHDMSQKDFDNFEEIIDKINIKNFPKLPNDFPLLYLLVSSIIICRSMRYWILHLFSTEPGEFPRDLNIIHPFLFARSIILLLTTAFWIQGWEEIAHYFGWDWEFFILM